jgi:hypothetical protein
MGSTSLLQNALPNGDLGLDRIEFFFEIPQDRNDEHPWKGTHQSRRPSMSQIDNGVLGLAQRAAYDSRESESQHPLHLNRFPWRREMTATASQQTTKYIHALPEQRLNGQAIQTNRHISHT